MRGSNTWTSFPLGLVLLFYCNTLYAMEIEGVSIPTEVTLSDANSLTLNGAGIRSKFFFKIYIGALYLQKKANSTQGVLNDKGSKRVMMHFLYDDLAKEKITGAWVEGFEENNKPQQFEKLRARLEEFNRFFPDTKKGDVIILDFLNTAETQVWFNGNLQGTIAGRDFQTALLKVWLGEEPADDDLKEAMLNAQ